MSELLEKVASGSSLADDPTAAGGGRSPPASRSAVSPGVLARLLASAGEADLASRASAGAGRAGQHEDGLTGLLDGDEHRRRRAPGRHRRRWCRAPRWRTASTATRSDGDGGRLVRRACAHGGGPSGRWSAGRGMTWEPGGRRPSGAGGSTMASSSLAGRRPEVLLRLCLGWFPPSPTPSSARGRGSEGAGPWSRSPGGCASKRSRGEEWCGLLPKLVDSYGLPSWSSCSSSC